MRRAGRSISQRLGGGGGALKRRRCGGGHSASAASQRPAASNTLAAMARHLFVLLLAAVCLVQVCCGAPLSPEEALRVLDVERRLLLEASGLLVEWRRSAADRPALAQRLSGLVERRDQLLAGGGATANWAEGRPAGLTSGSAPATRAAPGAQEGQATRPSGEGRTSSQLSSTVGWAWAQSAEAEAAGAEAAATGELADRLRQEAPSAEELLRLADEFRRIWRRFRRLDAHADASGQQ